jgi:hypothetical protein
MGSGTMTWDKRENFMEILGNLAEDVPGKIQHLVTGFEPCKDTEETPGLPHVHAYVEYKHSSLEQSP